MKRRKDSIIVELHMVNVAFYLASHALIKAHQKEFDRLYTQARKAVDPSTPAIKKRWKHV